MNETIRPEDYMEPDCVLCGKPYGAPPEPVNVPQQRIIRKMDEYMSRRDYAGAERHLLYWLAEARQGRDLRGELMILGELVGHYRKMNDREKALARAEEAMRTLSALHMEDTVSGGTTYVNCATAMNAFGENDRAMELFEKARAAYEAHANTDPGLLGGLYNNMALVCTALGKFGEAGALYEKALAVMEKVPGGGLEQAITYLNMADLAEKEGQDEKQISAYLDRAFALFDETDAPRDGYYAFVCEKCAPTFSYYGYFRAARELTRRAEGLYAGFDR